jgi:hypothetical protein
MYGIAANGELLTGLQIPHTHRNTAGMSFNQFTCVILPVALRGGNEDAGRHNKSKHAHEPTLQRAGRRSNDLTHATTFKFAWKAAI